jgi:hypothetical protein
MRMRVPKSRSLHLSVYDLENLHSYFARPIAVDTCRTLLLRFAFDDLCANEIKQEAVSPDGKYTATAFIRDNWRPSFAHASTLRRLEDK